MCRKHYEANRLVWFVRYTRGILSPGPWERCVVFHILVLPCRKPEPHDACNPPLEQIGSQRQKYQSRITGLWEGRDRSKYTRLWEFDNKNWKFCSILRKYEERESIAVAYSCNLEISPQYDDLKGTKGIDLRYVVGNLVEADRPASAVLWKGGSRADRGKSFTYKLVCFLGMVYHGKARFS